MRPLLVGLGTVAATAAAIAIYQRRRRSPPTLDAQFIASTIDALVFDCDGVIYKHTAAIPGVPEALAKLRAAGKRLFFVTNAASASRESLAKKLAKMGISGVTAADCITSASAAAQYLATNHPDVKRAYVVGGGGLIEELKLCGIESVGEADTGGIEQLLSSGGLEASLPIDAIVCGMQVEGLCYARLAKAAAYARDRKRPFVGTNPDNAWPAGCTELLPAGGCTGKYVEYASERTPDAIVGKPSKDLALLVQKLHKLDPKRTMMIGDRCNTDVAFGRSVGWWTLLVLTGCHQLSDVKRAASHELPDFVAESVVSMVS